MGEVAVKERRLRPGRTHTSRRGSRRSPGPHSESAAARFSLVLRGGSLYLRSPIRRTVGPSPVGSRDSLHWPPRESRDRPLPAGPGRLGADACSSTLVVAHPEELPCPLPC